MPKRTEMGAENFIMEVEVVVEYWVDLLVFSVKDCESWIAVLEKAE